MCADPDFHPRNHGLLHRAGCPGMRDVLNAIYGVCKTAVRPVVKSTSVVCEGTLRLETTMPDPCFYTRPYCSLHATNVRPPDSFQHEQTSEEEQQARYAKQHRSPIRLFALQGHDGLFYEELSLVPRTPVQVLMRC